MKETADDGVTVTNRVLHFAPGTSGTPRWAPALLPALGQTAQTDTSGKDNIALAKYRARVLTRPYRAIPEDLDKVLLALFKAQTSKSPTEPILHLDASRGARNPAHGFIGKKPNIVGRRRRVAAPPGGSGGS